MKVHCPKCKASYKIEDTKIPIKGAHLNCPKCKTRFFVKKESKEAGKVCPNCGYERQPKDDDFTPVLECPKCGIIYSKAKDSENNKDGQTDKDFSAHNETEKFDTKKCPYCAEKIKVEAVKCRFCGEHLGTDESTQINTTLSATENRILMDQARNSLRGKWGLAIGTLVVFILIQIAIEFIPVVGWIISILITGPISIGLAIFALSLSRQQNAKLIQIFDGFQKFGVGLGAYILQVIFVILWMLLLIIPGIIAVHAYFMTYYIIAENDTIGPLEAISKSKEMMRGNKWKLFCLGFRFLGWALLCILTFGIGFLWLFPYMIVSCTQFYDDLKPIRVESK